MKLAFRASDRRLIGAHILGDEATELIHVAQAVLHNRGTVDAFASTPHVNFPTRADAYKYAAPTGSDGYTLAHPVQEPSVSQPLGRWLNRNFGARLTCTYGRSAPSNKVVGGRIISFAAAPGPRSGTPASSLRLASADDLGPTKTVGSSPA